MGILIQANPACVFYLVNPQQLDLLLVMKHIVRTQSNNHCYTVTALGT